MHTHSRTLISYTHMHTTHTHTHTHTLFAVKDNGDGTYHVHYAFDFSGDFKMRVLMNGGDIGGSPFDLSIAPAVVVCVCL
jgi:hypothetical protein